MTDPIVPETSTAEPRTDTVRDTPATVTQDRFTYLGTGPSAGYLPLEPLPEASSVTLISPKGIQAVFVSSDGQTQSVHVDGGNDGQSAELEHGADKFRIWADEGCAWELCYTIDRAAE